MMFKEDFDLIMKNLKEVTKERDEARNKLAGYEGTTHHGNCGCSEAVINEARREGAEAALEAVKRDEGWGHDDSSPLDAAAIIESKWPQTGKEAK